MRYFKKSMAIILSVALICSLGITAFAAEGETTLTILGTSDIHSNIWGYTYEDDKETTNNGLARVYTYIQQVRAENPNTILIDNGDTVQGNILTDDIYNKQEGEHPVIAAMNYMGFDAMVLGNHEFNFQAYDLVERIEEQAEFPMLSANTTVKETGEYYVEPYTIVESAGVKVAIIGATTPNIPVWDGDAVADLAFEDMAIAVGRSIDEIGDSADIIIVSAHAGMFAEFDEEGRSDAAQKIIDENPEVDVLLAGHMHIIENEKQGEVVVGAPRNLGRDVVRFDLTLDSEKNIIGSTIDVVDMTDVVPSEEIRSIPIVMEAHQRTIDFIAGGISADGTEGGGALGTTTERFQPENEIMGIPEGKIVDTAVVDLINMIQLEQSGADVSAAALFQNTSDLPEGEINYGNIFSIYKFDNTLYRVDVTGAELKAYMEWSAECFNQWVEGDINISFDPEYPGYLYDMFAGVDYQIDLSMPKGERIKNVMFEGEPLADDQILSLAVNNYRYASALKSGELVAGTRDWESPNAIRDMIVQYFADNSPVAPVVDNNWEIIGIDLQEDNADRATLISLINNGQLETPYDKSMNLNDESVKEILAMANNLSFNGATYTVDAVMDDAGNAYYRLRDVATVLKGTESAFNIGWDGKVTITKGEEYTEDALVLNRPSTMGEAVTLSVMVYGVEVSVSAVMVTPEGDEYGNYYVGMEDLTKLLG